jgi:hypothetical protein
LLLAERRPGAQRRRQAGAGRAGIGRRYSSSIGLLNVAADATNRHLPPLRPAVALYHWLLTHGIPRSDRSNTGTGDLGALLAWMPDGLREPTARPLRERQRIPQETLGLRALRANPALLSHAMTPR